ncbi:DUF2867 domain-containing protein [Kordia zhangzhouensis]|uniref:DUF2867 domain-containing protein n=1 Tax=Kordia zhangzhouensis TaxID=1620405 RepID=UPI0006290D85|nr:DUF2867 domain-containing protein [Kordia zhangzhouensis]
MKTKKVSLPKESILNNSNFEYVDSFQTIYHDPLNQISSKDIAIAFFNGTPKWTETLFSIRNKIVSIFGLKTPNKTQDRERILHNFQCKPGERIGLFKVYHTNANEVIMGEDDKHLNFRISLLKDSNADNVTEKKLTISTTVTFNNWFGKLYFLPVKPFHKLIVPKMLKGIVHQIDHKANALSK